MRNRPDPLRVTAAQLSRAQRWPIGTAVTVTQYDGTQVETVTKSQPWKDRGSWWIFVEGLAGAQALARIVERSQ